MAEPVTLLWERAPSLAAGLVLLVVAAWILWFDFENRLHRAFGLLLVIKAVTVALVAFFIPESDLAFRLRGYFLIALPFAAAYFALHFRARFARREGVRPPQWPGALVLAAGAALLFIAHALHPAPYVTPDGRTGPFTVFLPLNYLLFAAIALLFVRAARVQEDGERRAALLVGAVAVLLEPAHQALVLLVSIASGWVLGTFTLQGYLANPFHALDHLLYLVTIATVLATVVHLLAAPRQQNGERRDATRVLLALCGPAVTAAIAVAMFRAAGGVLAVNLNFGFLALWTMVGALLLAYTITRHHFLGMEAQTRRFVGTGTIVAAVLLVFFVAKELLEEVLEARYPFLPGLVAAAIAALLFVPVVVATTHVVRRLLPRERGLATMSRSLRQEIYHHQVDLMWMDGVLTARERRHLDRLQERLELPPPDAARIEAAVMGAGTRAAAGARARTQRRRPAA